MCTFSPLIPIVVRFFSLQRRQQRQKVFAVLIPDDVLRVWGCRCSVLFPEVNVCVLVKVKAEVQLRDVVEDRQGQGHEDDAHEQVSWKGN